MGVGDFTKQEADVVDKAVVEMFEALPKTRQGAYLGHFNEVLLFVKAAKEAAPEEAGGDGGQG